MIPADALQAAARAGVGALATRQAGRGPGTGFAGFFFSRARGLPLSGVFCFFYILPFKNFTS